MTNYPTGTRDRAKEKRRKKKKHRNTNTNTPSPQRANHERARKKRTDDGQTPTSGGGRTEAPDTTYKARATPTSAREGPTYQTREHAAHEIGYP